MWYSVPGLSPVMLLTKLPAPVPSLVWLSAVVGSADVLQHTPLSVTDAPPSEVTFPPLEAVVVVMEDAAVVVTAGAVVEVVKVLSVPYAVPAVLVA